MYLYIFIYSPRSPVWDWSRPERRLHRLAGVQSLLREPSRLGLADWDPRGNIRRFRTRGCKALVRQKHC